MKTRGKNQLKTVQKNLNAQLQLAKRTYKEKVLQDVRLNPKKGWEGLKKMAGGSDKNKNKEKSPC